MELLKILLVTPIMWVWYLIFAALVQLRGARKDRHLKTGWFILFAGFFLFTFLSSNPVSNALTQPLLQWYSEPSPETLKNLGVITVLGGGGRAGLPSSVTYERIITGVKIFQQSGAKFLAVQGGTDIDGEPPEGEIMKKIALERGVPEEKILTDSISKTTTEHPLQLKELLPSDIVRIGIVTSSLHMPRAMEVFQDYFTDKTLVALPVGFSGKRRSYRFANIVPSVDALSNSTSAIHEWAGILWHKIRFL